MNEMKTQPIDPWRLRGLAARRKSKFFDVRLQAELAARLLELEPELDRLREWIRKLEDIDPDVHGVPCACRYRYTYAGYPGEQIQMCLPHRELEEENARLREMLEKMREALKEVETWARNHHDL